MVAINYQQTCSELLWTVLCNLIVVRVVTFVLHASLYYWSITVHFQVQNMSLFFQLEN